MSYKIFTKAPSYAELQARERMHWKTIEVRGMTTTGVDTTTTPIDDGVGTQWILPPVTLAVATQKISEIYKNVIFADESGDELEERSAELERGIACSRT